MYVFLLSLLLVAFGGLAVTTTNAAWDGIRFAIRDREPLAAYWRGAYVFAVWFAVAWLAVPLFLAVFA